MRRASGMKAGSVAKTLVLAVLVVGGGLALFGGASWGGAAVRSSSVAPVLPAAHAAPAAAVPIHYSSHPGAGNFSVSLHVSTVFQNFMNVPFSIDLNMTVANGTMNTTVSGLNIELRDVNSQCIGLIGLVNPCPTVANWSLNSSLDNTTATTSYSFSVNLSNLQQPEYRDGVCPVAYGLGSPCPYNHGLLPSDQYQIYVWANLIDQPGSTPLAMASASAEAATYLVVYQPTGSLVAPIPGSVISTGNTTVAISENGSYLNGATVTVINAAGTTVYSQSAFAIGDGNRTVVAATTWFAGVAGTYTFYVNVTAPEAPGLWAHTYHVTVIAAGGTVYQNSSSWHNASLLPGLSPAAGGTVLLVVGLVVGMAVALLLGRMVWATPKSAPAQAWAPKAATTAPNECSVCHQSFPSEEELKEHAKTAHGTS